uniref:Reverse transcriptase domain-containing protein n=1 Tax=Tanacetum cinerariifolium TaxID=118510 RepID=A0A699HVG5_TANCI|nr:hypothetical protein [Tanacetum cinerariifolium]
MLKQREQAANLAVQKEQEEQADDEEMLQSREKFMKDIQTFLQKFSRYSFGVMPKVLLIARERFSEIKHAFIDKQYQPEEIQKLMCKLLEDKCLEDSLNAFTIVLPIEEPEYSLSMRYEHLSTTLEKESDKVIKSSVEKLVPIPKEYEVTSDNESECDVAIFDDSFDVLEDHYEILSDSNNDDISSDDDAFEGIEYVEASLLDSELVSLEEENDVYQEEEFNLEDILQIQDVILREKLLNINRLIADIESLNDNPTPGCVLKSSFSFPIFEKSDNFVSDNSLPEFETFSDHTEETRSDNSITLGIENFNYDSEGDIHFLKELLVDDFTPLPKNESSNFDHHDDPSFPRPPLEPPDVEFFFDFEPNSGEVISVVMNKIDKLNEDECFDPGFSPLLLSAGSKDTIFDPDISV